ncbi:MAG: NAD kinase [Bifidobacteriaceae bacterium]|nr:NAD kinase [Bifidobacteriaceae bacterium]
MTGRALVVAHTHKPRAGQLLREAVELFGEHGWQAVPEERDDRGPFDMAIVLGGDGTLLRAVESVRGRGIPLLGVNVGHMGFLSEAEPEDLAATVARIVARDYRVEKRATVAATVTDAEGRVSADWALNEVTVEKELPQHMLEVTVLIDSRPLSAFGCDGVVVATPTGSTGHAYSAGGPVVWPEVAAMLMVPIAAHALFARPLVVSPLSTVTVAVHSRSRTPGVVSFDGRRGLRVAAGGKVEVRSSAEPVELVRLGDGPFADRLVQKFSLPVAGWRSGPGGAVDA